MPLTLGQVYVQLTEVFPDWTEANAKSFVHGTPEDQSLVIQTMRDAQAVPDPTPWQRVVQIVGACVEVANVVLPITAAVTAIYGLKSL